MLTGFWAGLGLLFSRLPHNASYAAHVSGRQSQQQQCGSSDVLKALNSDQDYDPVLNGHQLLTQGNTSALPVQASGSAINVSEGRDTNNVLLAEFCYSFSWSPVSNYIAHKAYITL